VRGQSLISKDFRQSHTVGLSAHRDKRSVGGVCPPHYQPVSALTPGVLAPDAPRPPDARGGPHTQYWSPREAAGGDTCSNTCAKTPCIELPDAWANSWSTSRAYSDPYRRGGHNAPLSLQAFVGVQGLRIQWASETFNSFIADFRGLKLTHNGAHDLDGVSGTRKPHCEVFFHCPWPFVESHCTHLPDSSARPLEAMRR
jgi:hypothetical protein